VTYLFSEWTGRVGKLKHAQGYEFNCKWFFFNMELGVLNILLLAGWQPYFKLREYFIWDW
jgi:hypothetical protein